MHIDPRRLICTGTALRPWNVVSSSSEVRAYRYDVPPDLVGWTPRHLPIPQSSPHRHLQTHRLHIPGSGYTTTRRLYAIRTPIKQENHAIAKMTARCAQ